jgi:hypothetical protein
MIWNRPAKRRKGGINAMQMSSDVMKLKKRSLFMPLIRKCSDVMDLAGY